MSTPGMVVWSPNWEAAQKQEAMQACALKADEILATVHIKTARPDDAVGTQVLQLVDGPDAVKSWFRENNGDLETAIEFNRHGNKDLSGFVLIETSPSSTLSYRPLKLDGTPKKAGRNPPSLATEVEQMTSFTYGELYSTDGFFTYPNDEAKPGTQSRAFLSPLLGFMVAVELSQSEVGLTEDKQIRLPCVNQYRIDLIFATPFGVTLKVSSVSNPVPCSSSCSCSCSSVLTCAVCGRPLRRGLWGRGRKPNRYHTRWASPPDRQRPTAARCRPRFTHAGCLKFKRWPRTLFRRRVSWSCRGSTRCSGRFKISRWQAFTTCLAR